MEQRRSVGSPAATSQHQPGSLGWSSGQSPLHRPGWAPTSGQGTLSCHWGPQGSLPPRGAIDTPWAPCSPRRSPRGPQRSPTLRTRGFSACQGLGLHVEAFSSRLSPYCGPREGLPVQRKRCPGDLRWCQPCQAQRAPWKMATLRGGGTCPGRPRREGVTL